MGQEKNRRSFICDTTVLYIQRLRDYMGIMDRVIEFSSVIYKIKQTSSDLSFLVVLVLMVGIFRDERSDRGPTVDSCTQSPCRDDKGLTINDTALTYVCYTSGVQSVSYGCTGRGSFLEPVNRGYQEGPVFVVCVHNDIKTTSPYHLKLGMSSLPRILRTCTQEALRRTRKK